MEKKLHKDQLIILNYIKFYTKKLFQKKIQVDLVPYSDFVTWANCIGKQKIKVFQKKKFFSIEYIKILLIELLSIGKNYEFSIEGPLLKKNKEINIIYSYCKKNDFKNSIFHDSYFKIKSSEAKNTFWFLISLDNYLPPKKNKNIFIVYKKNKKFNLFAFIKIVFQILIEKKSLYYLNNTYSLSKIYSSFFYKTFKNLKFRLFIPFENRPNQNAIIKKSKLISKKNLIYAFYHRLPEPLQTEMLYKNNKIDGLFVNSKIQKEVFTKYFKWPKNKLKTINSFRYNNIKLRKNVIYLPYEIDDIKFYFTSLDYLNQNHIKLSKQFSVSVHPLKYKNEIHIKLKKMIQKKINKLNLYNKNYISIILGEAGSVASECLETYGQVYHITRENFNIFSSNIWRNVVTTKLRDGIYLYRKKGSINMVNTNTKKNSFKNFLKNFSIKNKTII